MAKFYPELNDFLKDFINRQKLFFTGTAPTKGRINVSPKGMDTFRCLDNKTVAFLNLTGSGNETAAHLAENGRITLMFTGLEEKPLTLRLYGRGRAIHRHDPEWAEYYALFDPLPGPRQVVVVDIESVQTSCGFGVPVYEFKHQREDLPRSLEKQGQEGVRAYWKKYNLTSIDGLPTGLLPEEE